MYFGSPSHDLYNDLEKVILGAKSPKFNPSIKLEIHSSPEANHMDFHVICKLRNRSRVLEFLQYISREELPVTDVTAEISLDSAVVTLSIMTSPGHVLPMEQLSNIGVDYNIEAIVRFQKLDGTFEGTA